MPELAIYQDSKGKGTCRSCGAPIEWAELVSSGKRMPFDGKIVAVRSQANVLDDRVIEFVDTSVSPTHWSSCPQAKAWSRKR